jgi:hypothetical protein
MTLEEDNQSSTGQLLAPAAGVPTGKDVQWAIKENSMRLLGIITLLLDSIASQCAETTLMAHHFTHTTYLCSSLPIMLFLISTEMSVVSKLDSDLPDVFTFASLYSSTTSALCYRRTRLVCRTSETYATRIPDSMPLLQTKVKGKVPVHNTKAHEGSRSVTPPILSFSIKWIKDVNFMALPLCLQYPHGGHTQPASTFW